MEKQISQAQQKRGTQGARSAAKQPLPALRLDLVIDEYARDLRRSNISPKTIRDYQAVLSLVLHFWREHLGRMPTLDDLTVRNAEAFLDHLMERGRIYHRHQPQAPNGSREPLAPETLRTYVRTLKVFASWLGDPKQNYTDTNRLKLVPMPRKPHTYKLPLNERETQAFVDACDTSTVLGSRDLALLLTLLDGALRAGELIGLRVSDGSLDAGILHIASGKGQKTRQVAIGDTTKRILRRDAFLRDATAPMPASADAAFFQTDDGHGFKYEGFRRWLVQLNERAGVPRAFPHLLRHTSAVRTLEVPGSDIFTLKEKLEHEDISTTLRYLHMATEKLSERQRAFSLVDHLNLGGLNRLTPSHKTDGKLWHRGSKARSPQPEEGQS